MIALMPLAIVGLLAAQAPAPAFAAASDCDTPAAISPAAATQVMTEDPALVPAACDVDSSVALPTTTGVTYTRSTTGSIVRVTATADDGYVLHPDAQTEWTFDIAAAACTVVSTEDPTLVPGPCDVSSTVALPGTTGVTYTQETSGSTVTVTATAASGYALHPDSETSWEFDTTPTTNCIAVATVDPTYAPGTCNSTEGTVTAPVTTGVAYTVTRAGTIVTVTASADPGYSLTGTTVWNYQVAVQPCSGGGGGGGRILL